MFDFIEYWLNTHIVKYIDAFKVMLADEVALILRNLRTAPREVPVAFWSAVIIIVMMILGRWRKRR